MKTAFLLTAIALCGCSARQEGEPAIPMGIGAVQTATIEPQRFAITRVGIFKDGLAYGGERGVYVIKDTTTGQEFVGVSGVGISALGSHMAGKTSVSDER